MKIRSVKLKNFRGYHKETSIDFDDLTVFVGKNDIGKSTVLEALDIFFNEGVGAVKLDSNDTNLESSLEGDEETVISVCFENLPSNIVIDSSFHTTLKSEHMLNQAGYLEIVKKFNCTKTKPKAAVFIRAWHPTNDSCRDLLLKKSSDLKQIIQRQDIQCDNRAISSTMRQAIWEHYKDGLTFQEVEIDVTKEDAKRIWEKLSAYLPVYSLFQADRKNSDSDSEVRDPLKEAVKLILQDEELKNKLSDIATTVRDRLKSVSDRTLEKLREMDPTVAQSLVPEIPDANKLKWADVFNAVSITGDNAIPINKRGSGVRRLILLNFFRAEVERQQELRSPQKDSPAGVIYGIEEPETSQHTNNQRKLIKALRDLTNNTQTQIILTTHSPVVVKELDFKNLRVIVNDEYNCKQIIPVKESVLTYPSLNEINFIAFGEIAEEYHNELYGFLKEMEWLKDFSSQEPQRDYRRVEQGKSGKLGELKTEKHCLTTYIRHQYHHPENKNNVPYTRDELRQSIEAMRRYISSHKRRTVGHL